jgi:hypothetical protein
MAKGKDEVVVDSIDEFLGDDEVEFEDTTDSGLGDKIPDSGLGDEINDEDVTGALTKARLSTSLFSLMGRWKEEDIDSIIEDAKQIEYRLDKDELMMLCDFIAPNGLAELYSVLQCVVASWFRLGFHLENIVDLEVSANNDLIKKEAVSRPDIEEKKEKKMNEGDLAAIIDKATENERDYQRRVKKVRKKLNVMVSCIKEYINVLKKLLDYHNSTPSARNM